MATRSENRPSHPRGRDARTEDLAEMIARNAGKDVKVPGWLIPVLACVLRDLPPETFSESYWGRLRERAKIQLTGMLTSEDWLTIARWEINSGKTAHETRGQQR